MSFLISNFQLRPCCSSRPDSSTRLLVSWSYSFFVCQLATSFTKKKKKKLPPGTAAPATRQDRISFEVTSPSGIQYEDDWHSGINGTRSFFPLSEISERWKIVESSCQLNYNYKSASLVAQLFLFSFFSSKFNPCKYYYFLFFSK